MEDYSSMQGDTVPLQYPTGRRLLTLFIAKNRSEWTDAIEVCDHNVQYFSYFALGKRWVHMSSVES